MSYQVFNPFNFISMKHLYSTAFLFIALIVIPFMGHSQQKHERRFKTVYPYATRVYDSITAARIPALEVPESRLKTSLPESVDNSENEFWSGLLDQYQFYSCQQYAGVAYTFGYEYNRLRNTPGWYWENRFAAHYTWNYLNEGGRYTGVNFLHSFDVIRQQGHMTNNYYGTDTTGFYLGWATGYNKYYSGMQHRLKQVYAIPINSQTGINTLRHYLYDHLDGSETGGVACFTTDSWFEMGQLPPGTPEAGKSIQLWWHSTPDHGLCIVGYNDSIRYDVNNDGQFTNDIDINGDGIVDAKDWEIGGFKFANSWGYWWENEGFAYVLYSAMANNYEAGGVYNNQVYIVKADTGYHPLLTTKVKIDYTKRQRIRLIAGVSSDTLATFPEHTITFPLVNFQGGDHVMNGFDEGPGSKAIEVGLDITPLMNWFPENGKARLFLGVEERDPDHSGSGAILEASFLSYTQFPQEFYATTTAVDILDNDLTLISAIATANTSRVEITTTEIPPYIPGQHIQAQLEATGGTAPYTWALQQKYSKQPFAATIPANTGAQLTKISNLRPYAARALPFPFPYYGTRKDSIYINFNGFVTFDPDALPAPYITDELAMMHMFPLICPAFSQFYTYIPSKNDGVFYKADASSVVIWWKTSVVGHEYNSNNNFAITLYPDGQIEFYYGNMNTGPVLPTIYTGISKGDNTNFDIAAQWSADTLSGNAIRYLALPNPAGISISPDGNLKVLEADSSLIYSIPVVVTDEEYLTDSHSYTLSSGLQLSHELVCGEEGQLIFGFPAHLKLTLKNLGQTNIHNLVVRLQSMDSSCVITDSLLSIPLLLPGEPVIFEEVFNFSLIKNLPDGYPVRFSLEAQTTMRSWHEIMDIPVFVSSNQSMVMLHSFQINDPDGKLSTGETVDLNVTMANNGNLPASNVSVTLSCHSPYIIPLDTTAFFGDFAPGGTLTVENAYTIQAASDIPDAIPIPFTLKATDGVKMWISNFEITPYAPAFTVGRIVISDVQGNGNGILDPGDVADILIATSNSGGYPATGTLGVLTSSSPYIIINSGSANLGNIEPGDTVNAVFNVSVNPDAPLGTTVPFTYTVTSGLYMAQKQFTQKIGLEVEDFETGDFTRFPWTFAGTQPWMITGDNPFEGLFSARSHAIEDNQTSELLLQRNTTIPDTLSFFYKTSTEAGYDYLIFYIDGETKGQWAGETPWTRAAFPVAAGEHTFRWKYMKDAGVIAGSDCVWIDYVELPSTGETGARISGSVTYANTVHTPLAALTVNLKNNDGAVIQTATTNGSGLYLFSHVPPGAYSFDVATAKPWNGVSAADALLFSKHIAAISSLTGIWLASGDVNQSGLLTALDVLLIKKRIAAITNSFPSGDWLFNHQPFTLATTNIIQDFNGITFGDANGSYIPSVQKSNVKKGLIALGTVNGGNRDLSIPVYISDIENMGAFQFSIKYDANELYNANITGWMAGIEDVTIGYPEPGILTFVWVAREKGISIRNGVLFTFHFLSVSTAESALTFTENPTAIEFTDFDGNGFIPDLIGGSVNSFAATGMDPVPGFLVYPNPNDGKFYLYPGPDKISVSVRVVNSLGMVVYEKKDVDVATSPSLWLDLGKQPEGVYIVAIDDKQQVTYQKIVIGR